MSKKLNGLAKWIIIALAILTIAYNTIVTHAVKINDIVHLQADVVEIKQDIRDIRNHLFGKD